MYTYDDNYILKSLSLEYRDYEYFHSFKVQSFKSDQTLIKIVHSYLSIPYCNIYLLF